MENSDNYKTHLLTAWEESYKKGLLTFWILLSLRDSSKYINEIKEFITELSSGTISCENQSIYRSLRKYYDLEIVDYDLREGNKGPSRKYYYLTDIGKNLLNDFINRNLSLFINKKTSEVIFINSTK